MTTRIPDHIALCAATDLATGDGVPEWVHLIPTLSGEITTFDGRGPYTVRDIEAIIAQSMANPRGMPIDENHATDLAAPEGRPAPARGWIKELQRREDGLWGRVEWTEEGRALVAGKAYRGLSPVLAVSKADKRSVAAVLRASLVNTPNLRGLTALHQESHMDFMKKLAAALGLPETANEEELMAAVSAMKKDDDDDYKEMQAALPDLGVALGIEGEVTATALTAAAKAFGKDTVVALQAQLSEVTTELNGLKESGRRDKATAFIDGAIKEGRLAAPSALRDHYITRHMSDPASVEKEIAAMPPLTGTLITGAPKADKPETDVSLNAEQRGVRLARAAQDYQAQQKAKGVDVPWLDAVTHVSENR